ncbi:ABC transporter permease [Eupransor demetentiae]|uniref:Permease component NatB (NatB) n=1 Tax=Eupransor demetentiae TaxID=3109584 RepID=A0ABM9N2U3_9LACO|nr:ABC-type Na+ efflux pump [Lactobacillaceae bacterium LMG 33000]
MNSQTALVAKHTYITYVKKKSFWFVLLTPLIGLIAMVAIVQGIAAFQNTDTPKIAVINQPELRQEIKNSQKDLDLDVVKITNEQQAKKELKAGDLDAVLVLHADKATLTTQPKSNDVKTKDLKDFLNKWLIKQKSNKYGLTTSQANDLNKPYSVNSVVMEQNQTKSSQISQGTTTGLSFAISVIVFFLILFYANILANEISNEKSSRIMETLLAASSAKSQYFGKIFGVLGILLTQVTFYVLLIVIAAIIAITKFPEITSFFHEYLGMLTLPVLIYTLVFVIVAIVLYLVLVAISASLVNDASQTQQAIQPVNYLSMVPYTLGLTAGSAGAQNGLVKVFSYIPFVAQSLMPVQLASHTANWPLAIVSLAISVLALVLLAKYGERIYSRNVLSYSDENITKQLLKALKPSKLRN